jgi:4-amino-4-deoxy-L-arabinose transferase-like glycosyltransferase
VLGSKQDFGVSAEAWLRSRLSIDRRDLLWIVPLVLAVVHALQTSFAVTDDMSVKYMSFGLDIYLGNGYTNYVRGPLFSIFIAISYVLGGVSAHSAFWIVKIFTVLNVVLVYVAGRELFDKWSGFAGATLVATAFTVTSISLRHIDVVIATFMLASVISVYRAFDGRQRRWFGIAGGVLGLGFLVKEIALLLVPLPAVLYLVSRRTGRPVESDHLALLYATWALVISPWALYVTIMSGNPLLLLGDAHAIVLEYLLGSGGTQAGGGLIQSLVGVLSSLAMDGFVFFRRYIYAEFSLSPVFVLAWLLTVHRGVRDLDGNAVLGVALLLIVPLIVFETRASFRPGQILIFYLFSFVVVGEFLVTVVRWTHNAIPRGRFDWLSDRRTAQVATVVCLVLALTTVQVFAGPKQDVRMLEDSVVVNAVQGESTSVTMRGNLGHEHTDVILEHMTLSDRPRVLAIPFTLGDQLRFESKQRIHESSLPYLHSKHRTETLVDTSYSGTDPTDIREERLLYLTSHQAGHLLHDRNHLRYLTQEDVLEMIEKQDVEYLVSDHGNTFLTEYFERHPQFELIYQHETIRLFRQTAEDLHPISFRPRVKRSTSEYLTGLRSEQPDTYEWYRQDVLHGYVGLNASQIERIENGTYRPYFVPTTYDPIRYTPEDTDE